MKKNIIIAVILFLTTTVLQILLNYIFNQQILSRILFGVDYNTYLTNYYSGITGFMGLISESKMPYEWLFTLSRNIMILVCIILAFVILKKMSTKYKLSTKDIIIVMIIFSILSLYNVIFSIILYHNIPSGKILTLPILFIITTFIGLNIFLREKNHN